VPQPLHLHEDRLLPAEPGVRAIARRLLQGVAGLPIISPHGHTDPAWFAQKLTVDDTGALSPADIEAERREGMDEDMIQQEY